MENNAHAVHSKSNDLGVFQTSIQQQLTCRQAMRAEKCDNCENTHRKKGCLFKKKVKVDNSKYDMADSPTRITNNADIKQLKFPSPELPKKITRKAPIEVLKKKAVIKDFWHQFLSRCMEVEVQPNYDNHENPTWWKEFDRRHKAENYGDRVGLMKELGCRIFRTDNFLEVLMFLVLYEGSNVKQLLGEVVKLQEEKKPSVRISARNMIRLKCYSGGSWSQLYRLSGALGRISGRAIQCASQADVVAKKRKLKCPSIYKHTNPTTMKASGRYCKLKDVLEFTHSNPLIVNHMNFRFKDLTTGHMKPWVIYALYGDGTKQTKHVELLNFLCRCVNLDLRSRDPAALQILFLDTAKEGAQLFDALHIACLQEGIKDAMENGVWVVCLNKLQRSVHFDTDEQGDDNDSELEDEEITPAPCQLCDMGNEPLERLSVYGSMQYFHNVPFQLFHIKDKKAENLGNPVKKNVCSTCLQDMRSESWRGEDIKEQEHVKTKYGEGKKRKGASNVLVRALRQKLDVRIDHPAYFVNLNKLFVAVDGIYRNSIKQFAAEQKYDLGVEYHSVDLKDFQNSPQYAVYASEVGEAFNGYFSDPDTPMNHHFTDTLHLLITTMKVATNLLFVGAQRVENVVEGLGIHSLCHGLRCSGQDILANNILSDVCLKYGDRIKTVISADSGKLTDFITFDKALVMEFKKYLHKTALAPRIKELFDQLCNLWSNNQPKRITLKADLNTKAKQLEKIDEILNTMSEEEVVKLISDEEHQLLDRALFVRRVTKTDFAKGSQLDVEAIIKGSHFDLQGRDARRFFNGGFTNTLRHMNLFALMAQIQNREKLDSYIAHIAKLNRKTERAKAAVTDAIQNLSKLRDPEGFSKVELDDGVIENICSDVMSSLEALEEYDSDMSRLQQDIMNVSHDMLLLFAGNSGIAVDPELEKLQNIFDCLHAVLLPIVTKPCEDVEGMLNALNGHSERVAALCAAVASSQCNIKFGDHSEYFHHICVANHAERECRYLLSTFGIHLSDLNCETSEHMNKVLKGLLVRMQGFANRPVSRYVGEEDEEATSSPSVLNHLGYVIQEHMIKFYHNFDTLLPRKKPTHCGICDGLDHNARSCLLKCPHCLRGYYVGHRARNCAMQTADATLGDEH